MKMVASNNYLVKLFQLMTSVADLAIRDKRNPKDVTDVLQVVKDDVNFARRFFPETSGDRPVVKTQRLKVLLREWERLYEVFGLKKDFSKLRIPKKPSYPAWLIVVAQGMTPERIYKKLKELMPAWKYSDNLDSITSDRKADHDYAIWVRDRVEADEELKNKSANDLKAEGIPGITLEERLLLELKYWKETGKHLDVENWTLCSGSRDPDGDVPSVDWDSWPRKLYVSWCYPGRAGSDLRARVVVS